MSKHTFLEEQADGSLVAIDSDRVSALKAAKRYCDARCTPSGLQYVFYNTVNSDSITAEFAATEADELERTVLVFRKPARSDRAKRLFGGRDEQPLELLLGQPGDTIFDTDLDIVKAEYNADRVVRKKP